MKAQDIKHSHLRNTLLLQAAIALNAPDEMPAEKFREKLRKAPIGQQEYDNAWNHIQATQTQYERFKSRQYVAKY